jgi:DNA-binding SARP family transcriptional activator
MKPRFHAEDNESVDIQLLGGLRLLEGDRELKFSAPAKAVSLLAYLLVHRAQQSSRDAVAFVFWPDDDEPRARANLRRHIALIARALPAAEHAPPILADFRSIRWNPQYPCSLDVAEFERLSADPSGAAAATALYRGDLLPAAYDEWILPERERLRSMHETNLERLTERYAGAGDYAQAIATARALLVHDPWREDTVRTLLALRNAAGDRAGALQEFEQFATRLRRDLDAAPMPETVSRYESILHGGDAAGRAQGTSALERATAPATMPFVGRGAELLRLRQMWVRAMRGSGGAAIVSGDAGIGKSRLLTQFGATVALQGGAVVEGAATFPEALPYQAVVGALRSALPSIRDVPLDPTWLAAAAEVLPDLRDAEPALPRLPTLEPDRQQDRLFEAVWRCFEALSRARPVLLVFEDVHWAGPATIDLLAYLARRAHGHPLLVVITCRDDEADASRPLSVLRHALRRSGAFTSIPLGGITTDELAEIVGTVLGSAYRDTAFAQRAHDVCAGNPFFLAEIVRDCLAAPETLAEPSLPPSLATSIDARVAGLTSPAQSLAQVAAVVGRAFTIEIIAAAAGTPEAHTVRCMDELLDVRLIRETGNAAERGSGEFAFSHDLIRSRLYECIPDAARRRLHRRIGFVIDANHAGERDALATELARHYDLGLETERAAAAYLTSARGALRLYADGEALRALSRAVELTADRDVLYEAVSLRETILGRAGRRTEQLADIDRLDALADSARDESRRLECLRRRVLYARAIDDVDGQRRMLDALRARIAAREPGSLHAFCSEASATLNVSAGRYDRALDDARDAVRAYTEVRDDAGIVRSLCLIADIATLRVDPAASQSALDEATAIAVASSNEASIVRALAASALAAYMSVDYERAGVAAERGLEICRTIGDREGEADFLFRLGNIAGRRFAVAGAVTNYASATEIYAALNKPLGQAIVLLNSGLLFLKIGQHARALGALKSARAIFLDVDDLRGLTICALNLGMAAYLRGRFAAALRLSRKAVALARRLGNPQLECSALGNIGAAERELGERAASVTHSEAALEQRRHMAPMDIGSDLADMGLTYLRAGDLTAAAAIANEIEALPPAALESVMFPQNVLWSAARIYAAVEQPERYERMLRRAVAFYEERRAKIPEGPWRDAYGLLDFNHALRAAAAANGSDGIRTAG